jgi:hypothetical protein
MLELKLTIIFLISLSTSLHNFAEKLSLTKYFLSSGSAFDKKYLKFSKLVTVKIIY